MRKLFAIVFLFSLPCSAGPRSLYLSNAWNYTKHHKLELLVDASMFAASAADVETTMRATACPPCRTVETNPFLPAHPSRAQLWGVKLPFDVGLAIINHYTAKGFAHFNDPDPTPWYVRNLWILPSAGWDTGQAIVSWGNARRVP